jgi:hypothetical protein
MFVGAPIVVGAHSVSLQPLDGERFQSTLPAQLMGIIGAPEFEASIARCNAAYAPTWQRYAARFTMIGGFVLWALFIGLSFNSGGGPLPGMMFGAFACVVVLMFAGTFWGRYAERQRVERLRVAVAVESAYYNGEQRAAQFGPMRVPLSWTVGTGAAMNGAYWRGRPVIVACIDIDFGGPMFLGAQQQPFVQQAYGAPPPFAGHYAQQPYAQAPYAQPAQAPYAQAFQAPPAYSPQAQAFQGEGMSLGGQFAQPAQPQPQPQGAVPAWAAEGQPSKEHAVASPAMAQPAFPSGVAGVWNCERCGRVASGPDDRFCSACGGSVVRRG